MKLYVCFHSCLQQALRMLSGMKRRLQKSYFCFDLYQGRFSHWLMSCVQETQNSRIKSVPIILVSGIQAVQWKTNRISITFQLWWTFFQLIWSSVWVSKSRWGRNHAKRQVQLIWALGSTLYADSTDGSKYNAFASLSSVCRREEPPPICLF